jgi:phosphatidylserine/phosphatidylglycerophosphate/cardiolipin synthase-like enzyme
MAALRALEDLGILEPTTDGWRVDASNFQRSDGYRRGIRQGLDLEENTHLYETVSLLASVPATVTAEVRSLVFRDALELRAGIMDLIASARSRVVLASPFWDEETVDDLQALLSRRIEQGASVDLLGRTLELSDPNGAALRSLADRLDPRACRVYTWLRRADDDRFRSETFHFKVAIADDERAYLGSANFTSSGMRSRMELGVLSTGGLAHALARIVDAILI